MVQRHDRHRRVEGFRLLPQLVERNSAYGGSAQRGFDRQNVVASGFERLRQFPCARTDFQHPRGCPLLPGRSAFKAFYSSVVPYRIGPDLRFFGAEIRAAGKVGEDAPRAVPPAALRDGVTVRLLAASATSSWKRVAILELDEVVAETLALHIRFNPWNSGGGIRPDGFLMSLRDPAYRASQQAAPSP